MGGRLPVARGRRFASVLRIEPVTRKAMVARILQVLVLSLFAHVGWAATTGSGDRLSAETWRELSAIHQTHLSAERWSEALAALQALLRRADMQPFDRAVVQQNAGHVLLRLNRPDEAVAAFEASLGGRVLPRDTERAVRLQTARAHAMRSRWQAALSVLQPLFDAVGTPAPAEAHVLAAAASRELSDWRAAATHIERAISLSGRRETSWLQLRAYSLIALGEHAASAEAMLELIAVDPGRSSYWDQLGQIYAVMKQDERQLALVALAARMKAPDGPTTRSLIGLYQRSGVPDRAARLLQHALVQGTLKRDSEHLEWLADLWLDALETDAALQALAEANRLSPGSRFALRRARVMSAAGRWVDALAELEALLARPDLPQPGKVWLLLGIAAHEAGRHARAIEALRRAESFPESRNEAMRWLRFASGQ